MDQNGYTLRLEDNLVDGVDPAVFRPDFADAAGHELDGKMKAPYSSSALAVNTFAPWRRTPAGLTLAGQSGFSRLEFEAVCPTGLAGTSPHLDLLLERADTVLGVESKCLEFLDPHRSEFADSYDQALAEHPELQRISDAPDDTFRHLNAAQLVKHALGLMHTYPQKGLTLLYLFWEPVNWREHEVFGLHRAEVRRFAEMVSGARITFRAITYHQLWDEWSLQAGPAWLQAHVERLRRRYDVSI